LRAIHLALEVLNAEVSHYRGLARLLCESDARGGYLNSQGSDQRDHIHAGIYADMTRKFPDGEADDKSIGLLAASPVISWV